MPCLMEFLVCWSVLFEMFRLFYKKVSVVLDTTFAADVIAFGDFVAAGAARYS